jgi:F-type H+-transporting ATPase subunit delta
MQYCDEHGGHEGFLAGLRGLAEAFRASRVLETLLVSPLLSRPKKARLLETVVGILKSPPAVRRFAGILVAKGRIGSVEAIAGRFQDMLDAKMGRARAEIATPVPLSPAARVQLEAALAGAFGKRILSTYRVDESLYGGVVARVGNTILDSSLKGQLERAKSRLSLLTS